LSESVLYGIKTCPALGTSLPRHEARGGSVPTPLATCVPSAIVRVDSRSESEEAPLQYGEWSEASEVGRMCDHEPDDNGLGKSALESRSGAAGDADSIRDRLLRMLIGEGERHRRSGLDSVIGQCTNRFIVTVRRVVTDVWKARETDIRRSCGPHLPTGLIDEMDVLAYVLADALGRPLLHHDDTNKFGKKVAMQATRVEARLADAERQADGAVRKAAAAASANPALLPRVPGRP
jgi:hypothetical protein